MQNLVTGIHVSSAILTLTPAETISIDMEIDANLKLALVKVQIANLARRLI